MIEGYRGELNDREQLRRGNLPDRRPASNFCDEGMIQGQLDGVVRAQQALGKFFNTTVFDSNLELAATAVDKLNKGRNINYIRILPPDGPPELTQLKYVAHCARKARNLLKRFGVVDTSGMAPSYIKASYIGEASRNQTLDIGLEPFRPLVDSILLKAVKALDGYRVCWRDEGNELLLAEVQAVLASKQEQGMSLRFAPRRHTASR